MEMRTQRRPFYSLRCIDEEAMQCPHGWCYWAAVNWQPSLAKVELLPISNVEAPIGRIEIVALAVAAAKEAEVVATSTVLYLWRPLPPGF